MDATPQNEMVGSLTLVVDRTDEPALFGVLAALHARDRGARFLHEAPAFDLARDADAAQYVFRDGGLGASGLFFAETLLGEAPVAPVDRTDLLDAARQGPVVVPVHPCFGGDAEALQQEALAAGISCQVIAGRGADGVARTPAVAQGATRLPILFAGCERDHRSVYPAALLALEAAATSAAVSLDLRFVDPRAVGDAVDLTSFGQVAGLLLPGGSDMANVAGQIALAHAAIRERLPVLGLCLGMQTMATAFAQRLLGSRAVNLEEADPVAPRWSFRAMADAEAGEGAPLPLHRTGEQLVRVAPGTRLAALTGGDTLAIRCNHRYRLAPDLRPLLEAGGLVVNASSHENRVVDGIEWPDHPFFLGLQGHPELGRPGGPPSRVFAAFLETARAELSTPRKDPTHGS